MAQNEWISVIVLLIVGSFASFGWAEIIDNEPDNIVTIADALCQERVWHTKRIGRQSTIGQLDEYFSHLSPLSELATCRDKYLKPLQELRVILETSSDNVCSAEKTELINKFHWNYIVGSLSRKWRKASNKDLPKPVKVFFLHYANEIAAICQKTLPDRLEMAVGDKNVDSESLLSNKLGNSIDELSLALVPQNRVKNYDNFFLIWNQIIANERKKGHMFIETIDELTGEPVIALMKVKDPRNVWSMQQQCRHELRPIYQDTVLPIMKLLEMGYGQVDEQSERVVQRNKLIGNWYSIAQLCELLIPVNFYQDEQLKESEASLLSSFEETKGLGRPSDVVAVDKLPSETNIQPVQLPDDLLASAADSHIVKQVKSNLKVRGRLFRHFFKNVVANMKGKLGSKLKNFSLIRKTKDNKYVKESGTDIVKESEAQVDEFLKDDESVGSKSSIRVKRETQESKQFSLIVKRYNFTIRATIISLVLLAVVGIILAVVFSSG